MKYFLTILLAFTAISATIFSVASESYSEQFSIPSEDGLTQITGQIDFPSRIDTKKFPLVVMVPGTGLFDRDVHFGSEILSFMSDKEMPKNIPIQNFLFKNLAQKLNERGIAVLRYDYRGVSCNWVDMPKCETCKTRKKIRDHYFKTCINNKIRQSATPQNTRTDILSVYKYGKNHPQIDSSKIVGFGHSEGSVNLSYLIKNNKIAPTGLVFMGGLAENLQSTIKWQMVGRMVDALFLHDRNNDGTLTNEEIKVGYKKGETISHFPLNFLLSKTGSWTRQSLIKFHEARYNLTKNTTLLKADEEPYPGSKVTHASYKWWKMFFTDTNNIIENLITFDGPIYYHNGNIDAQTDFYRQKRIIESVAHKFRIAPKIVLHEKTGHGLGNDPIFGPITNNALQVIIQSIDKILDQ